MDRRDILLGFYISGIIIGGGILALPFVARDLGLPLLLFFLVFFGVVFHRIYVRIIDSIGWSVRGAAKVPPGLYLYDYAMERSGLGKFGHVAFTLGLMLYVIPADVVYVTYGMKSIVMLAVILGREIDFLLVIIGGVVISIILLCSFYLARIRRRYFSLRESFTLKFLLMISLWILAVGLVGMIRNILLDIITSISLYALSLVIGFFFPEKVFSISFDIYDVDDILPYHKVSSYLTILKVSLILVIPIVAFLLILMSAGIMGSIVLRPLDITAMVYSLTIIIFMYVGSGVYNILAYKWIANNLGRGKKAVLMAMVLSTLTYITFTILIILSVNPGILMVADRSREHAFIALSDQLIYAGLCWLGYATILVANIFALISVSVAYMGFTDTLAERLNIDAGVGMGKLWVFITSIIAFIVSLSEIYNVARLATDALGIAGNAGGGIFILILPWLMRDSKGRTRIKIATIFLIFVTVLNIFLMMNSSSLAMVVSSGIATIVVLVFGGLAIYRSWKTRGLEPYNNFLSPYIE